MPRLERNGTKKVIAPKEESPCCVFDFTMKVTDDLSVAKIRSVLNNMCKKYCFQIEKGDKTDYLHYQGRFSLKEKKRLSNVITMLKKMEWEGFHLSVTSKANRDNDFYACKVDSRVDGPFTNLNYVYIPSHVEKARKNPFPWQKEMHKILKIFDERSIHVIYDKKGNSGKSTFAAYMSICADSAEIPFINDFKDIMRFAYCLGDKKCYLLDMPRAANKERLFSMYCAIEKLKSGYCFEDRYEFRIRYSERPSICIFTNTVPDVSLLSKDMWVFWTINEDKELVKYEILTDDQDIALLAHETPPTEALNSVDEASEDEAKELFENYFTKYCNTVDEICKQFL